MVKFLVLFIILTCLWSVIISFCNTVFIYFFVLMFLWCLGYSVGTSKLHPQWLNSSANLTSFIWFWAQRCAFPFMFLRKDLPSRTLLPCHQPTAKSAFDFPRASFSLQPPFVSLTVNRQCLPFTHPSYPWFKPPKVSQLYLIFARQYHQPPHFKVYSDQPLQLFNALHVHFGCTGLMYTVV